MGYQICSGRDNFNTKKIELPGNTIVRKLYRSALLNIGESLSAYFTSLTKDISVN